MQSKKIYLTVNPCSGTRAKEGFVEEAVATLGKAGFEVEVRYTGRPGDAMEIALEAAAAGLHGVVVAGGDGTVNETARVLRGTRTALGILPLGSGNGLARHIGASQVGAALSVIADDNVTPVDCGTANGLPFFCTFGMGFDAAVSKRFSEQPRRGKISYVKSALTEFLQFAPDQYVISKPDGTVLTEKAFLVAVCNASQYGNNAYIAPRASIQDGLLDVTVIHSGNKIATVTAGVDLLTGFLDRNLTVEHFRVPSLRVERTRADYTHLDGDPLMMEATVDIQCHQGDLLMFCPVKEPVFKPVLTPMQSLFTDITTDIKLFFQNLNA